jgi:hypothetical protein
MVGSQAKFDAWNGTGLPVDVGDSVALPCQTQSPHHVHHENKSESFKTNRNSYFFHLCEAEPQVDHTLCKVFQKIKKGFPSPGLVFDCPLRLPLTRQRAGPWSCRYRRQRCPLRALQNSLEGTSSINPAITVDCILTDSAIYFEAVQQHHSTVIQLDQALNL